MAGVKTKKYTIGQKVNSTKQVKKRVTLVVDHVRNEKGNMRQKRYWVHEILDK